MLEWRTMERRCIAGVHELASLALACPQLAIVVSSTSALAG